MFSINCPYPGLRPFTESESIYFRGREKQVERIIQRLSAKKFLIINGASGDGKSSLVYAGLIPSARAGFFKAPYNNWIVADFRPERDPLGNLAAAIGKGLNIDPSTDIKKELSYGFSALADLYEASDFYRENKDQDQKKGSNMLILADQFEEFFTNQENYLHGKPSAESEATVNLLLETYKLAIQRNLPIYVVATMRSDYIGQCAALRGMPEAIGYSQFFVPRLRRQEVQEVIEGPAKLAGCSISRRLVQTLINSIPGGFDQLPVLQHALNQVWREAEEGRVEMDLIHLYKVGGIELENLDESDQQKVKHEKLDMELREYGNPSLNNILNVHGDRLLKLAYDQYITLYGNTIEKEKAEYVIKTAFQCLTRIDNGRAVRNRMTLEEIAAIVDLPQVDAELIDRLLQPFRVQGNTFLWPFVEEGCETLTAESVLDITHESLIRNWNKLASWTKEENDNLNNYRDFINQVNRWVKEGKSRDYLLPLGSLTYFEKWQKNFRLSEGWIIKYDAEGADILEKRVQAKKELDEGKLLIKKSANKHWFSRFMIKHGADKLLGIILLLAFIGSSIGFYMDYDYKKNENVIERIIDENASLLKDPRISLDEKTKFVLNLEYYKGDGNWKKMLNPLPDTTKYDIGLRLLFSLFKAHDEIDSFNYDTKELELFVSQLLKQSLVKDTVSNSTIPRIASFCNLVNNYYPHFNSESNALVKKFTDLSFSTILKKMRRTRDNLTSLSLSEISTIEQFLLNYEAAKNRTDLNELYAIINYPNEKKEDKLEKLFIKNDNDWVRNEHLEKLFIFGGIELVLGNYEEFKETFSLLLTSKETNEFIGLLTIYNPILFLLANDIKNESSDKFRDLLVWYKNKCGVQFPMDLLTHGLGGQYLNKEGVMTYGGTKQGWELYKVYHPTLIKLLYQKNNLIEKLIANQINSQKDLSDINFLKGIMFENSNALNLLGRNKHFADSTINVIKKCSPAYLLEQYRSYDDSTYTYLKPTRLSLLLSKSWNSADSIRSTLFERFLNAGIISQNKIINDLKENLAIYSNQEITNIVRMLKIGNQNYKLPETIRPSFDESKSEWYNKQFILNTCLNLKNPNDIYLAKYLCTKSKYTNGLLISENDKYFNSFIKHLHKINKTERDIAINQFLMVVGKSNNYKHLVWFLLSLEYEFKGVLKSNEYGPLVLSQLIDISVKTNTFSSGLSYLLTEMHDSRSIRFASLNLKNTPLASKLLFQKAIVLGHITNGSLFLAKESIPQGLSNKEIFESNNLVLTESYSNFEGKSKHLDTPFFKNLKTNLTLWNGNGSQNFNFFDSE